MKALPMSQIRKALKLDDNSLAQPASQRAVEKFLKSYLEYTTHLHNPGYIAHQVAVPNSSSALAELINGTTNNGMAVYEMGPAGVTIENFVTEWLCKKVGFTSGFGVLVFGGSIANLTALLAARNAVDADSWKNGISKNDVFLIPELAHYSIKRAICVMGYGESSFRYLPALKDGRTDVARAEQLIREIKNSGKRIVALACNACATATGLYDSIEELADICERQKIWFHVDGAHGASVLISKKLKNRMKGIERADSVVWDMHKMLQTSALCAAVLVKDARHIHGAFEQSASYLGEAGHSERDDIFKRSIECTRAPIGFKFYLNLLMHGESELARFIEHTYSETSKFYDWFNKQKDFVCPFPSGSNILLFKYTGEDLGKNSQSFIYQKLIEGGHFYITQANHNGETFLRLTVINARTSLATIRSLAKEIRKIVSR